MYKTNKCDPVHPQSPVFRCSAIQDLESLRQLPEPKEVPAIRENVNNYASASLLIYIVLICWDVKPFCKFFYTQLSSRLRRAGCLSSIYPYLKYGLAMENGKWCTIADAPFMCLANMNKEGIPLPCHLRGLVSTTTCWPEQCSSRPL